MTKSTKVQYTKLQCARCGVTGQMDGERSGWCFFGRKLPDGTWQDLNVCRQCFADVCDFILKGVDA